MSEVIKTATRDAYGKALVELGNTDAKILVLDAVTSLNLLATVISLIPICLILISSSKLVINFQPFLIPDLSILSKLYLHYLNLTPLLILWSQLLKVLEQQYHW